MVQSQRLSRPGWRGGLLALSGGLCDRSGCVVKGGLTSGSENIQGGLSGLPGAQNTLKQ